MCKMGTACGKLRISNTASNHLRELGVEIDAERQPFVFDGGVVGRNDGQKGKVHNAAQSCSRDRSSKGSRQRQRARAQSRPCREAKPFRSRAIETAHGAGFRLLVRHYEALSHEEKNGLWVAVKTRPFGYGGPKAYFAIALPSDPHISPRGWAFNSIGPHATPFALKHTNFPDASICAFTRESGAWRFEDGLLSLVDHFVLWAVKSWHKEVFGSWPGRQIGVGSLYRRKEFVPYEWCGCDSGKRYRDCHLGADLLVSENYAQQEFRRIFHTNYSDRKCPSELLDAARSRWTSFPDMAALFNLRRSPDEPQLAS